MIIGLHITNCKHLDRVLEELEERGFLWSSGMKPTHLYYRAAIPLLDIYIYIDYKSEYIIKSLIKDPDCYIIEVTN